MMRETRIRILLLQILISFCLVASMASTTLAVTVDHLRVDHLLHADLQVINGYPVIGDHQSADHSTVIVNKRPTFGWQLHSDQPGTVQSAYHIIIGQNGTAIEQGSGDTWDSGKVESSESTNIIYDGPPLAPDTTYYWRVKAWDQVGSASPWSQVSRFMTADSLSDYATSVYPLVKTDETAQTLSRTSGTLRLDFGRAAFGQLKMTLTARDTGDTITVRLGEAIQPDGQINRRPGGTIRYAEYQLSLRPGRHTYQLQIKPDKRNTGPQAILMPEYIGEVLPFRYCEIEGYPGTLAPADVVRASVHYPFDDTAAHFESSDPTLNAVWDLCKYSIKATSFAGIYVDGDRERIPYEADAYINQLCHYAVDSEYSMARRSHEYLLHHATWPTEWILQSVLMAYNDYLYTGDIRSAAHYYDDLKAKLLLPLRAENGLISTTRTSQTKQLLDAIHFKGKELRDIVDWPHTGGFGMEGNGETDGFVFTDFNAVVNAFHYKALCDMQRLASALGHPDDADDFAAKARETHHAFQTLLWDPDHQVYRDGIDTDHASLHTNMMALAFGLVPPDRRAHVMQFIRSRGMACSVYGSQFLMDAIYDAGDAQYGLDLLTSKSDRSWYNMIRAGSTITMEAWDNKYKPNQDWNHAWGAVPANIIPRKLMGIEPLEPGWKEFRVRPQIASLTTATIQVPTIRGPIKLTAQQDTSGQVYTLTVPPNTKAHIELPRKPGTATSSTPTPAVTPPKVTLNGNPVQKTPHDNWIKLPPIASGHHMIQVTN